MNVKMFSTAETVMDKNSRYRYSAKFHRKTSVVKSPFNKAKVYNFIKKGLQNMCFPVSFAKFFKITFLKNRSRRLVLCVPYF